MIAGVWGGDVEVVSAPKQTQSINQSIKSPQTKHIRVVITNAKVSFQMSPPLGRRNCNAFVWRGEKSRGSIPGGEVKWALLTYDLAKDSG